jgi:glycosyltransferase involved in cell wall biosynthesis
MELVQRVLLTGLVVCKNEAPHIEACVKSLLPCCDEVLVVDTGSTDGTQTLAQNAGAKLIQLDWLGYGPTKNKAASLAQHDWILSIDADERVSPDLAQEIKRICAQNPKGIYSLRRVNHYRNQRIRFGGWIPEFRARFYNRQVSRWNDSPVHEDLVSDSTLALVKLRGDLLHYPYASRADHWGKTERYAALAALAMREKGKRPNAIKLYLSPLFKFINYYFLRAGFLHGYTGYLIALDSMRYVHLKYSKLAQLYTSNAHPRN